MLDTKLLRQLNQLLFDLRQWRKFEKGLCDTCIGSCCYMPVEIPIEDLFEQGFLDPFIKELDEKEQIKEALKLNFVKRYTPSSKKFTLHQKKDLSCFFLDNNGRCSIYEKRFTTCRNHPKVGPKPNHCAYIKRPTN